MQKTDKATDITGNEFFSFSVKVITNIIIYLYYNYK